jgi:hypothetical protein
MLTLNKSSLLMLHTLEQFVIDPKGQHLDIVGHSKEELQATLQTIQRMLTVPLWVSPAAEDPLLLEMLQAKKKRFATVSGCWLNFDLATDTIAVFGINRAVALEFISNLRQQVAQQRAQEKMQQQQTASELEVIEMGIQRFKKHMWDTTRCEVSMQLDDDGTVVIGLSGTVNECMRGHQLLMQILPPSSASGPHARGDFDRMLSGPPTPKSVPRYTPKIIEVARRPNYDRVFSPPLSPAPKPSGIEVRFPMASPHTSPVPMCSTPTSPFRQASFQMSHAPVQSPPSSPLHVQTNSLLSLNSAFSPSSKSHSVGYDDGFDTIPSSPLSGGVDATADASPKDLEWAVHLLERMHEAHVDPSELLTLLGAQLVH